MLAPRVLDILQFEVLLTPSVFNFGHLLAICMTVVRRRARNFVLSR
jgi:hypothetical protein